jgi:hypothetical protein
MTFSRCNSRRSHRFTSTKTPEPVNLSESNVSSNKSNLGGEQMLTSKHYISMVFCRSLVFILCISLSTGCTTLKPLGVSAAPQSILTQIKPGDNVRLTTRDGKVREFKLKEATAHQLVGEDEEVNLSDITDIERREFSAWKTTFLVVGTVILVSIIIGYLATRNMNTGSGRFD